MLKLEDFKTFELHEPKEILGGANYTASGTRGGKKMAMDYENDDCTLEVWYEDGTYEKEHCQ